MKRLVVLLLVVFCIAVPNLYADHTATLIFNNPSSFIGLWETRPEMSILTVITDPGTPATEARFYITFTHDREGLVATGESGVKSLNAGPATQTFMGTEIDWSELDYEDSVVDPVYRSGRLPEGEYTVVIEIQDLLGEPLTDTEASFVISYPDPPMLLSPADGENITSPNPTFMWTPVFTEPGHPVTYQFKLVEVLSGQDPEVAIDRNLVHHEATQTGVEVFTYPIDALALEDSRQYAWQVRALDEFDNPASAMDGYSEIFNFTTSTPGGSDLADIDVSLFPQTFRITAPGQHADLELTLRDTRSASGGDPVEIDHYRLIWSDTESTWQEEDSLVTLSTPLQIFPGGTELYTIRVVFDDELMGRVTRGGTLPGVNLTVELRGSFEGLRDVELTAPPVEFIFPESGSEFSIRVVYPARLPIVFYPGSEMHAIHYEFDLSGHADIELERSTIAVNIPLFGDYRILGENPLSDVSLPGGSNYTHETGLEITSRNIETLISDLTDHDPEATSLEFEYVEIFEGTEAGSPVSGHISTPCVLQRDGDDTFNIHIVTSDPLPLVFHPGMESHGITLELDATGHNEIRLSNVRTVGYIPVIDDEVEISSIDLTGTNIPSGSTFLYETGILMPREAQERVFLLNSEVIEVIGSAPESVEGEYRLYFEGTEYAEGDSEGRTVTGYSTIPIIVQTEGEADTSLTFPAALSASVPTPLLYNPDNTSHDVVFNLEALGSEEIELDQITRRLTFPDVPWSFEDERIRISDVSISAGTPVPYTLTLTVDAENQNDILNGLTTYSALGHYPAELTGEYMVEFMGIRDGTTVVRSSVSVPVRVQRRAGGVSESDLSVSVTTESVLPLNYYPALVEHYLTYEFNASGHGDIDLTTETTHWNFLEAGYSVSRTEDISIHIDGDSTHQSDGRISMSAAAQTSLFEIPEIVSYYGSDVEQIDFLIVQVFEGMEGGSPIQASTSIPARVRKSPPEDSTLKITITADAAEPLIFHPGLERHEFTMDLDAAGMLDVELTGQMATWEFPELGWELDDPGEVDFTLEGGTTLSERGSLTITASQQASLFSQSEIVDHYGADVDEVPFIVHYHFTGMESGREVTGDAEISCIVRTSDAQMRTSGEISITASETELVFMAGVTEHTLSYTLRSLISDGIILDTLYHIIMSDDDEVSTDFDLIDGSIPGEGTTEFPDQTITIDRSAVLAGEDSAEVTILTKFVGERSGGERVWGSVEIPAVVTERAAPEPTGDYFTIVPGRAYVRPTSETTVTSGSVVWNGPGELLLLEFPFDSTIVEVNFVDLTFEADTSDGSHECTSGSFFAMASGDENVFMVLGSMFQAKHVTFDMVRDEDERLKINEAHINFPGDEPLVVNNIIINEDGMSLDDIDLEYTMFRLTFRITDIETGDDGGEEKFKMSVFIRLAGRDRSEEFCETIIKVAENGLVEISGEPAPEPFAIIPDTEYLLLNAVFITLHPDSSEYWAGFTVSANYPEPLEELGPTDFTFKVSTEGEIVGTLNIINEDEDDDDDTDLTKLDFGDFATFDLTFVSLNFEGGAGGFDYDHSYLALSGDFTFNSTSDDGEGHVIEFGDNEDEPGVRINFDGSVEWHELMLATDDRLNLGPVYIRLEALGFQFSPRFAFVLSGGLGVDYEDIIAGEVMLEELKVFSDGEVDFNNMVLASGNLSIMDMVYLGFDSFEYCDEPGACDITCQVRDGTSVKDTTIVVDKVFRMKGAEISVGEDGDMASGGFEELTVYERSGQNNFVLDDAELTFTEIVRIQLDLRYLVDDPMWGSCLAIAGEVAVTEPREIRAFAYGRFGRNPGGEISAGVFAAAAGLGINIGPVTLNDLGGGFFYNPLIADLELVRDLCDIDRPEITETLEDAESFRPPGADDPGSFAAMLYCGLYVGGEDIFSGRALLTITENNFTLDAAVDVLDGIAEGVIYLAVGWDPTFLEGNIQFEIDLYSLVGGEVGLLFYVYDSDTWAVMGNAEIKIIPSLPLAVVEAEFFVGPPGFLLDISFDVGFDIGILAAHAGFELMYWYNEGVSWGAYCKIYANGEILWGLVGIGGTLEGALIGTEDIDWLVYCVGSFYAELFWVTVFDGSVWISLDGDGFDGGEGRNSAYDQIIEDARNMADQMMEDMQDLTDTIDETAGTLETLGALELRAAGLALVEGLGSGGVTSIALRRDFEEDANYGTMSASNRANLINVKEEVFEDSRIYDVQVNYRSLVGQQEYCITVMNYLQNKHASVLDQMSEMGNVINGELPSVDDLGSMTNPVGEKQFATIDVGDGRTLTIQNGFEFDESAAEENGESMSNMQEDLDAYQDRLFAIVDDYDTQLKQINYFMGPQEEPDPSSSVESTPNELSNYYGSSFIHLNAFFRKYLDYVESAPQDMAGPKSELQALEGQIRAAIEEQAGNLSASNARTLAERRREFINRLLDMGGEPARGSGDWTQPESGDTDGWQTECISRGMDVWYNIPLAGFDNFIADISGTQMAVTDTLKQLRTAYLNDWMAYTDAISRVHDKRARLHELLYDLYDQLSISATRYPPLRATAVIAPVSAHLLPIGGSDDSGDEGSDEEDFAGWFRVDLGDLAFGESGYGGSTPGMMAMEIGDWAPGVGSYPDTPRGYFARKRDGMFAALAVPHINAFNGTANSVNPNYSYVRLDWGVMHSVGISEYAYRLEYPAVSSSGGGSGTGFFFFTPLYFFGPTWRSLGPWETSTELALMNGVDREGNYKIYLKAIGAGGYSVERQGTVDVTYAAGWGHPESSTLDSSDDTPPTTPVVDDSTDFTPYTDRITGYWRASDPQSGIQQYQYRIVTIDESSTSSSIRKGGTIAGSSYIGAGASVPISASYTSVTSWTSAAAMEIVNIRELNLQHNTEYFIEVKAQNGIGDWSEVGRSDGFLVDTTMATAPEVTAIRMGEFTSFTMAGTAPPFPGATGGSSSSGSGGFVMASGFIMGLMGGDDSDDGAASSPPPAYGSAMSGMFTGTTGPYANTVSARWAEAEDPESGIEGYYYALGSNSFEMDIVDWTFTKNRQVMMENIPVSHGMTVTFQVRAVNGAGMMGEIGSDTLRIEFEDETPPSRSPFVVASYDADTDTLIAFWWGDGGDSQSGIAEYQWCIQRALFPGSSSGSMVRDWASNGKDKRIDMEIELPEGASYLIKVRAVNGVGLFTEGTSEPVVVGTDRTGMFLAPLPAGLLPPGGGGK